MKFGAVSSLLVLLLAPTACGQGNSGNNGGGSGGSTTTTTTTTSTSGAGGTCYTTYKLVGSREKYTKDTGSGAMNCNSGLVCLPLPIDEGNSPASGTRLKGTCNTTVCGGKEDPEDDSNIDDQGTQRVTICHRTCSETNPWVRITIDDDAWNGTKASGCGHMLQHDVRDECAKYGPINNWAAWGANKKDYLLKWHGTRNHVRAVNNWPAPTINGNNKKYCEAEKDYWFNWERACPYVRSTACCSWAEGSCCGDNPAWVPSVKLEKTAGPPGTCGVDMSKQVETYSGKSGQPFEYCYLITNNGDVCLEDMTLTDQTIFIPIAYKTPLSSLKNGVSTNYKMCPGQSMYITHPSNIPHMVEGPIDATVEGTREGTRQKVQASNHAAVVPVDIQLEKTAGPRGTCGVDMSQQVELYGAPTGANFAYCYTITNPVGVCLKNVMMSDTGIAAAFSNVKIDTGVALPSGMKIITDGDYVNIMCAGETVYLEVNSQIPSPSGEGPKTATVVGTANIVNGPTVTDQDPAAVIPVALNLKKKAGPIGTCAVDMSKQVEVFEALIDGPFEYCYVINVPSTSNACVNSIYMSDPVIRSAFTNVPIDSSETLSNGMVLKKGSVTGFVDVLCAGQTVYLVVPSTLPGPSGESKTATLTGIADIPSGPTLTDSDPATVIPPNNPPMIALSKTVGPPGTCGVAMDQQVDSYTVQQDSAIQFCYAITNIGAICLKNILMSDPMIDFDSFTDVAVSSASALPAGFTLIKNGVNFVDTLCSGKTIYLGLDSTMPKTENGFRDATVNAVGEPSPNHPVSAMDPAKLIPIPPVPAIVLEKSAGRRGTCGLYMNEQSETFTGMVGAEFEYCYTITVPHNGICVNQIMMSDTGIADHFSGVSITSSNSNVVGFAGFTNTLCPNQVIYFTLESTIPSPNGEGPIPGTVTAQGTESPFTSVSDSDPAAVDLIVVVSLQKKSGPPGTCGVDMSQQVESYEGLEGDAFEYCYAISNPGGLCLKNIMMKDSQISTPFSNAPVKMGVTLGNGLTVIPSAEFPGFVDVLCAGQTVYLSKQSTFPADVELFDAIVDAEGNNNKEELVSAQDHAEVLVVTAAPTPTPICEMDMGLTDDTICPGYDTVTVVEIKTETGHVVPDGMDITDIIYDLAFTGTSAAAPEVSFKVESPFDFAVDAYIQYSQKVVGSSAGAMDPACNKELQKVDCDENTAPITAACIHPTDNSPAFAVVSVFFVSADATFGLGSNSAEPYECCHLEPGTESTPIIEYTLKILCECPMTERRALRGESLSS